MKQKAKLLLATLACALVLGMSITPAWAYFTDTTEADGGLTVNVTPVPGIDEWYANNVKYVFLSNDGTVPLFVRATVFADSVLNAEVITGDNWTGPDANGWYYYKAQLAPGETTGSKEDLDKSLQVKVTFPPIQSEEEPSGAVPGDNHNVVVVYEATPVQYNADGTEYADWSYSIS